MKDYKHYFFGGLIFVGTVLSGFITFAAWTNIQTKTDGTTINATLWNELVNNINTIGAKVDTMGGSVPAGAIMSFYLTTCPSGWIPADGTNGTPDLRGQFLRGLNTFNNGVTTRADGKQDPDSRILGAYQIDDFKTHSHAGGSRTSSFQNGAGGYNGGQVGVNTGDAGGSPETRPKNIAVLYCIKN